MKLEKILVTAIVISLTWAIVILIKDFNKVKMDRLWYKEHIRNSERFYNEP